MPKNNVNPDHYKVRGRERPGDDVVHEVERQQAKQVQRRRRGARGGSTPPAS
jgi:hypothetical protein